MRKLLQLMLFAFLSGLSSAYSFSCYTLSFEETYKYSQNLLAEGIIVRVNENNIHFKITKTLKGNSDKDTIVVWDVRYLVPMDQDSVTDRAKDLGMAGDTLILELPRIEKKENAWDVVGDYRLNKVRLCEQTPLIVKYDTVYGNIRVAAGVPEEYKIIKLPYSEFYSLITTFTEYESTDAVVNIYPNPADDKVTITAEAGVYTVQVFDFSGQLVRHYSGLTILPLGDLGSGVYTVEIRDLDGLIIRKRLVRN